MSNKRKHETTEGMHPSNPYYNNPPDFIALSELYPSLKPYITVYGSGPKPKGRINFKDPMALRELTYSLLRNDFSIELDIPIDSLCPAIPNRLNYICWIEDLMKNEKTNMIRGIDIGAGASCIYPLLGCARNKNWQFTATDIDDRSIQYAKKNINNNKFQKVITLIKNESEDIFPNALFDFSDKGYDFCMCNPPFYQDEQEIQDSLDSKELTPSATCSGTSNEMITRGGEVQFVKQMIEESRTLRSNIRWYTSMLGKKSSVEKIISVLKDFKIVNYTLTTFHQGRTTRWGVAWSFDGEHAPQLSTQNTSKKLIKLAPTATVLSFSTEMSMEHATHKIRDILSHLLITLEPGTIDSADHKEQELIQGRATANTWSRAARRELARKAKGYNASNENEPSRSSSPTIMGFDLCLFSKFVGQDSEIRAENTATDSRKNSVNIQFTWTIGHDRNIFESFFLHIRNRFLSQYGQ